MFLGHFGLAFAAKRVAPRPSLGTLILAAELADVTCAALLLVGIEKVKIVPGITTVTPLAFVYFPYTHSLVADIIWAALFAGGYWLWRRDNRGAGWIAALVLSHWVLDALSHRPDMPTWPGGPIVGAGLWHSLPLTLIAEFGLFAVGVWIYATATRARDRLGSALLWTFVATLIILYLGAVFGPPPPSEKALAITSLAGWLLVAWAYWIDMHRVPLAAI
jgi:membrane-bound metal-dependent hydrolase YbcI (DUF457 family)